MRTRISIIIWASIYFFGCSIYGDYYLRNSSEKEVTVILKFADYVDPIESNNLKYLVGVKKIKRSSIKKLKEGLNPFKVEGRKYWYKIPAKSFVNIGLGINYQYRGTVESIEEQGKETDLSDWEVWTDRRTSYGGYICYLDL